jgi:hypothetical protein
MITLGLLALLFGSKASVAGPQISSKGFTVYMPAVVREPTHPLVAVYYNDWRLIPRVIGPQVIVAIWRDGRVVWSLAPIKGGRPYRTGRITPGKLRELLAELEKKGTFKDPNRRASYLGPDSEFITIAIADGMKRLNISSWHEVYEVNPGTLAIAQALISLNGRSREEVLAGEPESYRRFRALWGELRQRLRDMLPRRGEDAGLLKFVFQRLE